MSGTLVLLRHGESQWNLENRFTGWADVPLTENGRKEAAAAGELLKQHKLAFDVVHTSVLVRAIKTANLALEAAEQLYLPVVRTWRLNERHYGALQGLNKAETAEKHSPEQVQIWRRSYETRPPALALDDNRHPRFDPRYAGLPSECLPGAECLKDTLERMLPYWQDQLAPALKAGQSVLVVAHGNSLRALVKHLNRISDADIMELNIPTGKPWRFDLDADLKPKASGYLD